MPRVHRYIAVADVRAEARNTAKQGLHVGIDLARTDPLFGHDWDKDARDLGRLVRQQGVQVVVRGPGADLPLGALDPYVVDQVRACHDRALAASMHYGCHTYVVPLNGSDGLTRTERMSRADAIDEMVGHLAASARSRSIDFAIEQCLEHDVTMLEAIVTILKNHGAGIVLSPSRAICAGEDLEAVIEVCGDAIVSVDLTDREPRDLEPRIPGHGVLKTGDHLLKLLQMPNVKFFTVDNPRGAGNVVGALNKVARQATKSFQTPIMD